MSQNDDVVLLLSRFMASGRLEPHRLIPALKELCASAGTPTLPVLLDAMAGLNLPEVALLRREILKLLCRSASECHERRVAGAKVDLANWPELSNLPLPPLGWRDSGNFLDAARQLIDLMRARGFIENLPTPLPAFGDRLDSLYSEALKAFKSQPGRWTYLLPETGTMPDSLKTDVADAAIRTQMRASEAIDQAPRPADGDVDEAAYFNVLMKRFCQSRDNRRWQQALLDQAFCWPTDMLLDAIPVLCSDRWAQERAVALLVMRFGRSWSDDWVAWEGWHAKQTEGRKKRIAGLQAMAKEYPDELLLLWYQEHFDERDPAIVAELTRRIRASAAGTDPQAFIADWQAWLIPLEMDIIRAVAAPPTAVIEVLPPEPRPVATVKTSGTPGERPAESEPRPVARREPAAAPEIKKAAVVLPPARLVGVPAPDEDSIWREQFQKFFAENWYIAAGLSMVVVGASLLAYFTWDKHWILRYTIMPSLLALFTLALPFMAGRIERKFEALRSAAMLMRSAAIGLLPVNFMAIGLLARDHEVTHKVVSVPLMAAVYLVLFGTALFFWCRAVHKGLPVVGVATLLSLNSLVCFLPGLYLSPPFNETGANVLLGTGLYGGFLLCAAGMTWFSRRILTLEMLEQRMVPWFFSIAVAGTFVEVFAWGHWTFREVPQPHVYAVMAILAGGLVVFTERRFLKLGGTAQRYGGGSFIAYALIMFGVVMGMGSPEIRIVALILAGVVWLFQASLHSGGLHYAIGLTLLMLGTGSIALHEQFPRRAELNLLPVLGLGVALAFRVAQTVAGVTGRNRLGEALRLFLPGVLLLAVVVGVLSQWYYRSDPRQIGALLLAVGAIFAWRAGRTKLLVWVYTTMAIFAMVPLYFGCVDMRAHAIHGNNLVFGLALVTGLWLAALSVRPSEPWIKARSTVALSIGGVALAAMLLRVFVEQGRPGEAVGLRAAMDVAGPVLMAIALAIVTYHSRSLIPAALAVVIVVVLMPELKESLRRVLPHVTWGSGLGSSSAGLALAILVFPLQRWKRLANLGPGDPFFNGTDFPFGRRDHTLFTVPLLTASLFLIVKVDTWNFLRNYLGSGVGVKTAVALGITACVWQLLAAARKKSTFGWVAAFLTFIMLILCFRFLNPFVFASPQNQLTFLMAGVLLVCLAGVYHVVSLRVPWTGEVLLRPVAAIVREGGWLGTGMVTILLFGGEAFRDLDWLGAFLLLLLVWHGLRGTAYHFGAFAFVLGGTGILSFASPGEGALIHRLTFEHSLGPMLFYALGIQTIHVVLEWLPGPYRRLKPLLKPMLAGSAVLAAGAAVLVFWHLIDAPAYQISVVQQVAAVALILLTARIFTSAETALVAAVLLYIVVQAGELAALDPWATRVVHLLMPWRLATLGLSLALVPYVGRLVRGVSPSVIESRQPLASSVLPAGFTLFPVAIVAAVIATARYVGNPALRHESLQLWAPYLAAATLLAVAMTWRHLVLFAASAVVVSIGNVQAVDITVGERLLSWDLSHFHIACLGLVATLFQGTLVRRIIRRPEVTRRIAEGCLVVAGLVLLLLSLHYFTHPNIETMSIQRFALSGAMALVAGLYYRSAARTPVASLVSHESLLEGVYHFGIAMAMWCFALMIPALRNPATALVAIGLPPLYFFLRAEIGARREKGPRYRDSSVVLCFLVLALYTLKGVFHLILFPDTPVETNHYHVNAPVVLAAGLVLLRLHGLGATFWSAVYGGIALAAGIYFGLTAFPGLSPFDYPVPAAWTAIVLGHFLIAAGSGLSPLRSIAARVGRFDPPVWANLRTIWGNVLLAGAQLAAVFGLHDAWRHDTFMIAPLILGAASLFVHQGVSGSTWPHHVVAGALAALALHIDFIAPSYLDREYLAAVIVGLWTVFLMGDSLWSRALQRPVIFGISALFLTGTLGHVLYHRPWSIHGLAALSLAGLLWALATREEHEPSGDLDPVAAGTLLLWPPALVYFSQAYASARDTEGLLQTWSVLSGVAAVMALGWLARFSQTRWAAEYARVRGATPRLIDQTLTILGRNGRAIHMALTWAVFLFSALFVAFHYQRAYSHREMAMFVLVWVGLAAAWVAEGHDRPSLAGTVAAELCVLGLCVLARRQLALTTGWWTPQYDIWASLGVSAVLTGAKGWLDDQDRSVRLPPLYTMFALPVFAIGWTLYHDLGTELTLVVVGLHSILYAYLGREGRESGYNVVATSGFTAFVLILFWSKLELRVVQAYVIPVGVGLLALVQLFSKEIPPATRSLARAVVLLAMLGSAGYYALLDGTYPAAFNFILIAVGLAAMLVGTILKVRLYLALGFLGIIVDLGSVLYKTVVLMDAAYRMTVIGLLILLVGIVVVGGSIFYKARADSAEAWLGRVRSRLAVWE